MKGKNWLKEKIFNKEIYTRKRVIIIIAVVLVIALMAFLLFGRNKKSTAVSTYVEVAAQTSDISETIEQSGVVEPYERFEITSLVKGEIMESPFEEGDFVNEGDVLYRIDDEDVQLNIEKTQNNIKRAEMNLNEANSNVAKLSIYANASGKLTNFNLHVGDTAAGVIGTIVSNDVLTVNIPFAVQDYDLISVGDSVTITSALYMTTLPGRVSHKYDAAAGNAGDGSVLKNIEVEIANPGALAAGTTFAATVHTGRGDINSAGSGEIGIGTETMVKAEVSGTVSGIHVKDGDYVRKGQLLISLSSDSLTNSKKNNELNLQDSRLSLESNRKTLENYNITSPISGTVITKTSKAGDKIDNTNAQTVMMVVADMSKMKFTISVDELDIAKIALGQTAVVDADALPDQAFKAEVTSIASEGVSSGDGVTTFTVELTINEPGNLKSGMNVNANILINEAKGVVAIPEEALMGVRGTKASVLVKSDNATKKTHKGSADQASENSQKGGAMNNIPEGCEVRQIEVGISDGTFIEVVSGLSEGEIVVYIPSAVGTGDLFSEMMKGVHGGGGMPGGGRMPDGGGMPGGGGMTGGSRQR